MQKPDISQNGQAGAIEVTPEMIEAGADELGLYNPDFDVRKDFAVRIFRRMLRARDVRECMPPSRYEDRQIP